MTCREIRTSRRHKEWERQQALTAGSDEHDTYTDDLEDWLQRVPPVAHKNTSEVRHG